MGYTVQQGDTLSSIAKRHGLSVGEVIAANPQISDPNLIRGGQSVNIPSAGSVSQAQQQAGLNLMMATAPATPQPTAPAVPQAAPPNIPEGAGYDLQSIQSLVPTTPTYDVQGIQSLGGAPQPPSAPTYDVQGIQSLGGIPEGAGVVQPSTYDVQSIQSLGAPTQQPSAATPTEQAAALGGGVPPQIDPYFADLSSGMQYLYSQWPYNVGGVGTPTELAAGGGYGPSSFQWSESPASLSELAQGRTPVGPALAAATTVETFLTNFGVRPEFITAFVAQSLGLTPADLGPDGLGYVQDLYGRWIALDYGDEELVGGGDIGVGFGDGAGRGVSRYTSPTGFRSGYTSGLIQWRIGFS